MDFSSKASVEVGDTLTLKLSGNTKSVDWKVDNPKCLRVKESGKSKIILVGVNSGTVRVSAKIGEQKKTCDVKYVNEEYYRVNGGYICSSNSALGDGGKLKMQRILVYNQNGYQEHKMYGNSETYLYGVQYEDTAITVNCPTVKTHLQYLIDESGQAEKSFFEQLDCLQKKLNELVVYPRSVLNSSKPNKGTPYPFLTSSPYEELGLNSHVQMYEYMEDGWLAQSLYPFVLDSLGSYVQGGIG